MNDRETRRYDVFGRAVAFGEENKGDFAAGSEALSRFEFLKKIGADLDTAKARQRAAGNTARSVLIDALGLDVQNITRTVRALDQDEPGLADKFPPPNSASDQDLLTATDAILAQLLIQDADSAATKAAKTALAAKFIKHELPADFVKHLADDRAAVDAAGREQEVRRESGVGSTTEVDRLIKEGMKHIRYLDAIMHNKYARDPDKLRAWMSASHIARAPQREKKPPTPPPPPK